MTATVEEVYRRLAPVYDVLYGVGLRHGRRRAMARLAPRPGERILEVGVGTGLSAVDYPSGCRVVAIDISGPMLGRAYARLKRRGVGHVALCRMDAGALGFPDQHFHAVYAPYVINVVPDPLRAAREMVRVCRQGGRVVLLNHFANNERRPLADRMVGAFASRASGVNWRLDLESLLRDGSLAVRSIEPVNLRVTSVVVCQRL